MVKGVSKQVIVVQSPDEKIFDQVIFILNERAVGKHGITDDLLLKEARKILGSRKLEKRNICRYGMFWGLCGALLMGAAWLVSCFI